MPLFCRKCGRPKPLEREVQLRSSTDNTWNKKDECLRDRPSLSPSYSKGLKAADPLDCVEFSPSVSSPALVNPDTLDSRKNPTDIKDLNKKWRDCSKEDEQECFASCDERGKGVSVSPNKDPSPQNSFKDSFNAVAKLSSESSVLPPLEQYLDLEQDIKGNASSLTPSCCTAIPLELGGNGDKSVANCASACNSDSSAVPELNKFTELESLCSDQFSTENTPTSAQCSAFGQNEHIEETPLVHSYSVHTYRTVCPSYSWQFYQTGSNCHQVTQTYQEFSSYETRQLTPTTLTATSMMYNTQSSTFYSQSYSHFRVGESQGFNFAQSYPVHSYFSSTVPFPYSCQQWPSWYTESHPVAQAAYLYSSNIGLWICSFLHWVLIGNISACGTSVSVLTSDTGILLNKIVTQLELGYGTWIWIRAGLDVRNFYFGSQQHEYVRQHVVASWHRSTQQHFFWLHVSLLRSGRL